jgi:Fe-Mn family superoxide dismutase
MRYTLKQIHCRPWTLSYLSEQLQQWIGDLSKSEPVVVYCAYGFHVGCKTAIKLREAGFDAKYMNSGHSGWKAVGYPLKMNA